MTISMKMECVSRTAGEKIKLALRVLEFCHHTFVSCNKGSLASPGACGLCGCPCPPQCFFQLPERTFKLVCSGINKATRRASNTEHAPNKNGGPGMMEFWKEKQNSRVSIRQKVSTL